MTKVVILQHPFGYIVRRLLIQRRSSLLYCPFGDEQSSKWGTKCNPHPSMSLFLYGGGQRPINKFQTINLKAELSMLRALMSRLG